jgi:hypothetical protein
MVAGSCDHGYESSASIQIILLRENPIIQIKEYHSEHNVLFIISCGGYMFRLLELVI